MFSIVRGVVETMGCCIPDNRTEELVVYLAVGRKIPAIKLLRKYNNLNLTDSKAIVDKAITIISNMYPQAYIIA